jgi:hypothetical protein
MFFPIIVPYVNNSSTTGTRKPVFETLSKYTDSDPEQFFDLATQRIKEKGDRLALTTVINFTNTIFKFDNSRESRKVALVNFVLNLDIKGPTWFERVFKKM